MKVPLIKGDAVDTTAQWTDGMPQNMYAVNKKILGAEGFMTAMPGLETVGVGPLDFIGADRGAIWVSTPSFIGQYRVIGGALVKVEDDAGEILDVQVALGEVPGDELVRMAYSFNNLAIVADGRLFYYNPNDGFREITDPDVGSPIDITWGDNVFILTDGATIYHSEIGNEESFDPLSFTDAQFQPDPSLGLSWNENSELLVFGTLTIQPFINSAGDPFLFSPVRQKNQKIGILSTVSKSYYGNTYYMLGTRENSQFGVYTNESGRSQKISTAAIDKILNQYERSELQQALVEVVDYDGTVLCLIHLPESSKFSLCFNVSIANKFGADNAWSKISSTRTGDTSNQFPYRAYNFVHDKQRNKWFVGDRQNFIIGVVDPERGDQYGDPQECILYSPFLKLETLSIDMIELETVPGVGSKGPFFALENAEEVATMFISRSDNGRIYGKEWTSESSVRHNYDSRFRRRALGYVRDWVSIKFRTYSKTRQSFASFTLEAS